MHEKLLENEDKLVFGLSGGVDSTTLVHVFGQLKKMYPKLEIFAVTYDDFQSKNDPIITFVKNVAAENGIPHYIVSELKVRKRFNLRKSIKKILSELMNTEDAHKVMYLDHHFTRVSLEIMAREKNVQKICLGVHATDLLAGILNSFTTGFPAGIIPKREISDFTYVYPLCYTTKKEMKYYLHAKDVPHFSSNKVKSWEMNPLDRNYYYYLADIIQDYWPGCFQYFFHGSNILNKEKKTYRECSNCCSFFISTDNSKRCDVCDILAKHNYILT